MDIAKILKDCPKGMPLYSPIFGECEFDHVCEDEFATLPISVKLPTPNVITTRTFYPDGRYEKTGECVLFPSKEKRDWNCFNLKRGDFAHTIMNSLVIVDEIKDIKNNYCYCFCLFDERRNEFVTNSRGVLNVNCDRFATPEEKQKLIKIIDKNGYVWDDKKLELRKKLKFKVGDTIQFNKNKELINTINRLEEDRYIVDGGCIFFEDELEYSLVKEEKYQFKPFEKVLVRDLEDEDWYADFFIKIEKNHYRCIGKTWTYCIPYEGNENLLNTEETCQ